MRAIPGASDLQDSSLDHEPGELEQSIAEQIRRAIFGGALLPGIRLTERELCAVFDIGRSRIRAVLQMLAQQRVVRLLPNRGAVVATPSIEEARQLFEARRAIESHTAATAARVMLTHQILSLRERTREQVIANQTGQLDGALRAMGAFHLELAKCSNNVVLVETLEPLIIRTSLVVAVFGHHLALTDMPTHQSAIIDCLEAGLPRQASRAMERCLFKLEGNFDWKGQRKASADLASALSRVN